MYTCLECPRGRMTVCRERKKDLQPPNRRSRNQHQMAFQMSYARSDIYKYRFFPDTIRDWNALPSIISTAESSEDPVARFTSLVRSRN